MQRITVSKLNNLGPWEPLISDSKIQTAQIHDNLVFVSTKDGILLIYDLSKMDKLFEIDLKKMTSSQVKDIGIAKIGTTIAMRIKEEGVLVVFDLQKLRYLPEYYNCHMRQINCLIPYGNYFVTGSDDMTIRLWELTKGQLKHRSLVKKPSAIHLAKNSINCLATYGSLLVSGSKDKTIKFWNKDKLWLSHSFQNSVLQIFPCPSSQQILILTADCTLHFVSILSVLNKKLQVRGNLEIDWNLGKNVNAIELNEQFVALGSGRNIEFMEVNLIKSIKCEEIGEEWKNGQQINSFSFQANSLFCGIDGLGVSLIKF